MDAHELMELGFNKNEAIVYATLAGYGKADAKQLIAKTKFHKNMVYDNLAKLIDKGLVTYIIEEGKHQYQLASGNTLVAYFEEQELQLQKRKEKAKALQHKLVVSLKNLPHKQEATIYKGVKAIKGFFEEILTKGDYVVFGAPQESVTVMGDVFWKNYNLRRGKHRMKTKMIFNASLRGYGAKMTNPYIMIRYFDKDFEPLTETLIQDGMVAIIVWTEDPILFLLQDKAVASSYKHYFEVLWKQAKP